MMLKEFEERTNIFPDANLYKAIEEAYNDYGFAAEKVKIFHSTPIYEINRHGQLRQIGTADRSPLYNATDWNYIRFNCGCMSYELVDDTLRVL